MREVLLLLLTIAFGLQAVPRLISRHVVSGCGCHPCALPVCCVFCDPLLSVPTLFPFCLASYGAPCVALACYALAATRVVPLSLSTVSRYCSSALLVLPSFITPLPIICAVLICPVSSINTHIVCLRPSPRSPPSPLPHAAPLKCIPWLAFCRLRWRRLWRAWVAEGRPPTWPPLCCVEKRWRALCGPPCAAALQREIWPGARQRRRGRVRAVARRQPPPPPRPAARASAKVWRARATLPKPLPTASRVPCC